MGKKILLFLALLTHLYSNSQEKNNPVLEVNPFLGTAPLTDINEIGYTPPEGWRVWAGLVFPGAALPNAMVQLTPVTKFRTGAGYQYEDSLIIGFAHTMKGHWNLGNIPVLPVGNLPKSRHFASSFSHKKESASPGYYEVELDKSIKVRLTSTLRCGFHHYSFTNADSAIVVMDLNRANNRVDDFELSVINGNQISGFQKTEETTVYFYTEFNKELVNFFSFEGNKWVKSSKFNKSKNPVFAFQFENSVSKDLYMKIGLSFVSTEQAKKNLKAELDQWDFDNTMLKAERSWHSILSKVKVKGGSKKERMIFYTSLYRAFLWPALRSDVDGSFRDVKGEVCKSSKNYYTNPSLWDTFRNKLILLSILEPRLSSDIIQSLVDRGSKSGHMPIFFHGDHASSFIAGAYLRGVSDFDVQAAYNLLIKNANDFNGPRPYLQEYIEKGYISTPLVKNPHVETRAKAGVAKTLEFSYNDYSVGLMAASIGDTTMANKLFKRSQNYNNVFDPGTNFMRGRLADGSWCEPFDAEYPYYEYMFREANAWQQTFFVPHDIKGLVKRFGGNSNFENKLDSLFTKKWNPNHIARNVCCFIGQYCHGNQPDHQAPYLYYFVDKPWKSQKIINQIHNLYGIGQDNLALPGMDDTGEMSSWYVFTAMGLYPFSPAEPNYLISIPVFDEVELKLGDNKVLNIKKVNGGNSIIKKIKFNGKNLKTLEIDHDLIKNGGQIKLYTE